MEGSAGKFNKKLCDLVTANFHDVNTQLWLRFSSPRHVTEQTAAEMSTIRSGGRSDRAGAHCHPHPRRRRRLGLLSLSGPHWALLTGAIGQRSPTCPSESPGLPGPHYCRCVRKLTFPLHFHVLCSQLIPMWGVGQMSD